MSDMIRYLYTLHLEEAGVAVAYFLFDGKSENSSKRQSLAVLQTLTAQLFVQVAKSNSKFVETRLEAIADSQRRLQFVPRNQLCTMLREAMLHLSMTYLILDALDECEDASELLRLIRQLLTEDGVSLKLLLSSRNIRNIPELVAQLPAQTLYRLVLDAQTMRGDITQLIKFRTETMDIEDVGSPQETCKTLVDGSHGLILLAKLRLDTLEQQLLSTDVDMETALKRLPIGVHQYYELALARLSSEDRLLARDMFIWVLYAQATLSMEELIEASSLLFDGPWRRSTKLSKRGIRRLGAGLVEVIDNQVRLSHFTVREFAANCDWRREKPSKIPDQITVHSRMAAFLLDYMSQSDLVADILSTYGLALKEAERWPLLGYAVRYWLAHLRLSASKDLGLVREVEDFLESNKGLAWWIQFTGEVDSYNWWLIPQVSSDLFTLFYQTSTSSISQTSFDVIGRLCERHVFLLKGASSEQQPIAYIRALNRLADKEAEFGRLEKAERLLHQAIKNSEGLSSELDESSAILSLISLCRINFLQGNFSEAVSLCDRVDSLLNLSKAEHNRYFVRTRIIRGEVENSCYHSKLSEVILRKAHNHASMTLGDQDPYTLGTRNALALTCLKLGKLVEAEGLLDIAYYKAVLGKEHPSTLTGAENFATVRRSAGKLEEAEKQCSDVYVRRIKSQGPKARDTIQTGSALASIYVERGKLTAAADLQQNLMMHNSALEGTENHLTLLLQYGLAWIKHADGKLQESEELLKNIHGIRIRHLGLKHPWTIDILEDLAFLKREEGNLVEAERLQMEVLQFRKDVAEDGDPQLLKAMENLALIKGVQGKLVEAEQLQGKLLSSWKEIGDEDGPNMLMAMANLAITRRNLGKLEEAEQLEERVLEVRKKIGDKEGPHVLTAIANLAITKQRRGKLEEAETMEEHVLKARRQISGEDSPDILTAMANLAITKRDRRKLEEAETMEEYVLKARRQISGEDSPDVLTAMASLAITKQRRGKLEEAETIEEHVLKARRQIFGEDSPDVLTAMANLTITKRDGGKLEEAETMGEHVLKARRQISGEDSPDVLTAIASLAITKQRRDKLEEAETMEEHVLKARRQISGEDSPDVLTAMINLAITKLDRGKLEEAETMGEHVLKARRQISGEDSPDVLTAIAHLAITKRRRGKLEEAEIMAEHVLKARRQISPEHPDTLMSMGNLAVVLTYQGRYEAAEEMNRLALVLKEKVLGPEHPDTLLSMHNLAGVLAYQGKYEAAEEMHRRTLALRQKVLGPEHRDTLESMNELVEVLRRQGEHEASHRFKLWRMITSLATKLRM